MAQLPGGDWLMQQIDGKVRIFQRYTEEEILSFDPSDANDSAVAQRLIYDLDELNDEQKSFAHFWSGYFYAHATMHQKLED